MLFNTATLHHLIFLKNDLLWLLFFIWGVPCFPVEICWILLAKSWRLGLKEVREFFHGYLDFSGVCSFPNAAKFIGFGDACSSVHDDVICCSHCCLEIKQAVLAHTMRNS